MPYTTHIKDLRSGKQVKVEFPDEVWAAHHPFMWEEGNRACDCYRGRIFSEATGQRIVAGCSMERFEVRITDPDGKEIYRDGSESE